ncbi:hypothetical protein AXX17_AT5G14890 [Arabidopsis thaliana]|uniref:Uncharacterized protein n=1 Tax=Arabidopsis thaliana TaxID=3702 RepID=A0A178UFL9_ARATH|nr:hypothetical protein AXX17_AT5G14890 [Arabidopsis thaliana]
MVVARWGVLCSVRHWKALLSSLLCLLHVFTRLVFSPSALKESLVSLDKRVLL